MPLGAAFRELAAVADGFSVLAEVDNRVGAGVCLAVWLTRSIATPSASRAASREQRRGIGQVGEAVHQPDRVTQQNAALVEQSSAAAEGLQAQALTLADAVAVFRLTDTPA